VAITPDGPKAYVTNLSTTQFLFKGECRDGGFKNFEPPVGPFKNQGQCIKHVNDSL